MSPSEQQDLESRILWHELMLALLVAMQALNLFWVRPNGMSVMLLFGFAVLAGILWIRFLARSFGAPVKRALGMEVN